MLKYAGVVFLVVWGLSFKLSAQEWESGYRFEEKNKNSVRVMQFTIDGKWTVSFSGGKIPNSLDSKMGLRFYLDELRNGNPSNRLPLTLSTQILADEYDLDKSQIGYIDTIRGDSQNQMAVLVEEEIRDGLNAESRKRIFQKLKPIVEEAETRSFGVLSTSQKKEISNSSLRSVFEIHPLEFLMSKSDIEFDLTAEQISSIQVVNLKTAKKADEFCVDIIQKFDELHSAHLSKLGELLTDRQQKQLEAILDQPLTETRPPGTSSLDGPLSGSTIKRMSKPLARTSGDSDE